ncbi:MAG TPA: hypothetical protein VN618_02060 [Solirubrobacteraceae bacterium]|nr:hypothetical protein [Solirubrobacteraceae bacterium]
MLRPLAGIAAVAAGVGALILAHAHRPIGEAGLVLALGSIVLRGASRRQPAD